MIAECIEFYSISAFRIVWSQTINDAFSRRFAVIGLLYCGLLDRTSHSPVLCFLF